MTRDFFTRDPLTCARGLIGCELLWKGCGGIIVETEAYSARNDEACHTFSRPSSRRFVADHPPGTAYVYLNYGVHWLLNFLVKGGADEGFVLIRALEPAHGIADMRRRRKMDDPTRLCSGPGKLTQAIGIDGSSHGLDFLRGNALILHRARFLPRIIQAPRIGISRAADLPWRFFLRDNPHVSVGHPEPRIPPLGKI
ncbi:MAG: DNA-3-methyladenine glycosylase [Terrimicrobiaceae bacterium]|nr:DNA-3-methyladenine glycosylase [Terrimicrobiaceae bacterium]